MPATHPDAQGLLQTILANPAEDAPRLVFADWLEERGQAERAEFIRAQLELAKRESCPGCAGTGERINKDNGDWMEGESGKWIKMETGGAPVLCDCSAFSLVRRARELLKAHGRTWLTPAAASEAVEEMSDRLRLAVLASKGKLACTFRRGFVGTVLCHLADWLGGGACSTCSGSGALIVWSTPPRTTTKCRRCNGTGGVIAYGPALAAVHPVEQVICIDRQPIAIRRGIDPGTDGWWAWLPEQTTAPLDHASAAAMLPPEVRALLDRNSASEDAGPANSGCKGYPTERAASADLSAALITWARSNHLR